MEAVIEAYQLRKDFKNKTAVRDVSFSIFEGEIFGFLGHNGAGKTTTIRLLTGQIRPTSGKAMIAGFNSSSEQGFIKPIIGVVSEAQNLYERMTGLENLNLFANLYDIRKSRVQELLALVNLQSRARDKIENYSNGMKQRLLIARALLHEPDVIFLDEPTRGLDPTSARDIKENIKDLAASGVTVFLTTHNMEEADELCDRVAFIKEGSLITIDTPQNLKLQYGERSIILKLYNDESIKIPFVDPDNLQEVFSRLRKNEIQTIHSQEATLEDVFLKLAGQEVENEL